MSQEIIQWTRRQRYQNGCLYREKRKSGPAVWVFRYRDSQSNRKEIVGDVLQYPTKSAAQRACESLRKPINTGNLRPRTLAELVAHHILKELSEGSKKAYSTREMYGSYIRTWILPHWGEYALSDVGCEGWNQQAHRLRSFRRSLATLLQASGASVKATQDMLRHASSRLTLELYAQSVPEDRRDAQAGILRAVTASVPKRSLINS